MRVPHHLIDLVDVTGSFDAAQFVTLAGAAVKDIQARGRVPVFCGGTGLYFKAFLEGLGEAPPSDAALRAELEVAPLETLLGELRVRDPATFDRIDHRNPRRVIRAVEVIRLTGRPFSEQRAGWKPGPRTGNSELFFGVSRKATDLRARIDLRVDKMFALGLLEETRRLLEIGLAQNQTAMQAIGYRQVVEHLRGERSLGETIALVKIRTRQFAKRQLTWFKKHSSPEWIELAPGSSLEDSVERIASAAT
jgi:tRNA dimethylallyltransferase